MIRYSLTSRFRVGGLAVSAALAQGGPAAEGRGGAAFVNSRIPNE